MTSDKTKEVLTDIIERAKAEKVEPKDVAVLATVAKDILRRLDQVVDHLRIHNGYTLD